VSVVFWSQSLISWPKYHRTLFWIRNKRQHLVWLLRKDKVARNRLGTISWIRVITIYSYTQVLLSRSLRLTHVHAQLPSAYTSYCISKRSWPIISFVNIPGRLASWGVFGSFERRAFSGIGTRKYYYTEAKRRRREDQRRRLLTSQSIAVGEGPIQWSTGKMVLISAKMNKLVILVRHLFESRQPFTAIHDWITAVKPKRLCQGCAEMYVYSSHPRSPTDILDRSDSNTNSWTAMRDIGWLRTSWWFT
jgi:hypothetical protein